MGFWNYFVGEAYCLYHDCKDKKTKVTKSLDAFKRMSKGKRNKWITIDNPNYKKARPFCKSPGRMTRNKFSKCMGDTKRGHCPFLGYVLADKEEFIAAVKAIKKVPLDRKRPRKITR